jgi:hypothetical protein
MRADAFEIVHQLFHSRESRGKLVCFGWEHAHEYVCPLERLSLARTIEGPVLRVTIAIRQLQARDSSCQWCSRIPAIFHAMAIGGHLNLVLAPMPEGT